MEEKKIAANEQLSVIRAEAIKHLADSRLTQGAIARAVDVTRGRVCQVMQEVSRESLRHPRKLKAASKLFDKVSAGFLGVKKKGKDNKLMRDDDGNPIVEYDQRVKASDAVRLMELAYKAHGELERDQPQGTGQSFTQITINHAYLGTVIEGEKLPEK